jgi:hypothetical protein
MGIRVRQHFGTHYVHIFYSLSITRYLYFLSHTMMYGVSLSLRHLSQKSSKFRTMGALAHICGVKRGRAAIEDLCEGFKHHFGEAGGEGDEDEYDR